MPSPTPTLPRSPPALPADGADTNVMDSQGSITPLITAISEGGPGANAVAALLAAGADVNFNATADSVTPLHAALVFAPDLVPVRWGRARA